MKSVEQRLAVIFGVLLLLALVGIAAAAAAAPSTAEGCVYRDLNGNRVKDASEACEPGWTLHAKILDNNGIVRQEGDFVTDTAGTSGKFSYPIPAATAGSWSVVISETPPTGFVVDSPTGASYTKTYTASLKTVSGFAFGNQQVTASAEGCRWVDTDGDRQKDDNELCQAGWTLHATVTDDQGIVVSDEDFVTNTLGTSGKFSYPLPVPPTGKTWKATISEVAPNGYVNVVPVGGSYAKNFSAINPVISGFSFGDQQVSASAEGCAWVDTDSDRQKDDNELCQAGWTLHATVTDDQGGVVSDGDFVTNTLGTNGKFSYPLPVPPTGKTWKATISEIAPNGWVNVVPVGGSYTKAYSAINPVIGGYSFGNQAVTASAEGCKWVDTDGDRQKDDNELCESGWTLHATVTDDNGGVVSDEDFVTNNLGTGGKFSYPLPVPPTGKTWKATISEIAPDGYVNVVPVGGSYTRNYSAINPVISGFSFGDQQVKASAEGCAWVDTDSDRQKDDTELCEAGWTLHATVTDDQGMVVSDEDFVTNTLGTNGKFSYSLPVPPTGRTWTVTISEAVPDGWVNVVPGGPGPAYSRAYSAINPLIGGFSFGHQQSDSSG